MTEKFPVGTVVQLKTKEGPQMVIHSIPPDKRLRVCIWFEGREQKRGSFPVDGLIEITEK